MLDFVRDVICPMIRQKRWARVCEIGASHGQSTDCLLACTDVSVTVIDPCLDLDLAARYAGNSRVTICKGISLDVLPGLNTAFDCILIDGDHNWYTVFNELKTISDRQLLRRGGMIFLHDVDWPYGRRDMYYQPETIPKEHRHNYACLGIRRGKKELAGECSFNAAFCNALQEGGARNGVLTAVEDFLRAHRRDYQFAIIRKNEGLAAIHLRNGFADDFRFFKFQCATSSYNLATLPKRFARSRFPGVYTSAKAILGRS